MKLYLIKDDEIAKQFRQLNRLNADCVSFRWSKTFVEKPKEVTEALDVIENYIYDIFDKYCNKETLFREVNESDKQQIFSLFRCSSVLEKVLGSGVILSSEKEIVIAELKKHPVFNSILAAVNTGQNVLIN